MIKRLVRYYKKEVVKDKDGREFRSNYYYLELVGGQRIYVDIKGDDSKVLARLIAEKVFE